MALNQHSLWMSEYDTGWTTTKDWGKKTTSRGILTREKENDRDREREGERERDEQGERPSKQTQANI